MNPSCSKYGTCNAACNALTPMVGEIPADVVDKAVADGDPREHAARIAGWVSRNPDASRMAALLGGQSASASVTSSRTAAALAFADMVIQVTWIANGCH